MRRVPLDRWFDDDDVATDALHRLALETLRSIEAWEAELRRLMDSHGEHRVARQLDVPARTLRRWRSSHSLHWFTVIQRITPPASD